jgi:hypothetical protein
LLVVEEEVQDTLVQEPQEAVQVQAVLENIKVQ